MVHLFNRRDMIKKFHYDLSLPATGPLYQQSEYADPSVKALEYDQKLALKLLKEDGWVEASGDKFLSKRSMERKLFFHSLFLNQIKNLLNT